MHNWGYCTNKHDDSGGGDDALGPHEWTKLYPAGDHQSPINIQVDLCELNYHQLSCDNCGLSQQLRDDLNISSPSSMNRMNTDNNRWLLSTATAKYGRGFVVSAATTTTTTRTRTHLDSIGNDMDDDSQRSPSTSSAGSEDQSPSRHLSREMQLHQQQQRRRSRGQQQQLIGDDQAHDDDVDHQQQPTMRNESSKLRTTQNTRVCLTNKKIFLGYPRYLNTIELCNTGHAWQINLPPGLATHTLLAGPPLGDREYRLAQLHCHWGDDCQHGSEHKINGRSFSAEIHFVHWNCKQFGSIEEASKHKHGLAVVGVLVQASDDGDTDRNKHLDKIISKLSLIREPSSSVQLSEFRLDLKKLMPANRWNYASYEGSLTTPPLSEVVDWIVFLQPIRCSASQIEQFRQIRCPTGSELVENCRPVQPVNNRLVSIWTHSH